MLRLRGLEALQCPGPTGADVLLGQLSYLGSCPTWTVVVPGQLSTWAVVAWAVVAWTVVAWAVVVTPFFSGPEISGGVHCAG